MLKRNNSLGNLSLNKNVHRIKTVINRIKTIFNDTNKSKDTFHNEFKKYIFYLLNSENQEKNILNSTQLIHDIYVINKNEKKKQQQKKYIENIKKKFLKNDIYFLERNIYFYYNIKYNQKIIGTIAININKDLKEITIWNLSINKTDRKQNHLIYIFYFVYHSFVNQYKNSINNLKDFSIILYTSNEKVIEHYKKYGFIIIETYQHNRTKMIMDKNFYKIFDVE